MAATTLGFARRSAAPVPGSETCDGPMVTPPPEATRKNPSAGFRRPTKKKLPPCSQGTAMAYRHHRGSIEVAFWLPGFRVDGDPLRATALGRAGRRRLRG